MKTNPELADWIARINRETEPWKRLARGVQRFALDVERASKAFEAARNKGDWQRVSRVWRQLLAARDRGDHLKILASLQLGFWMMQQIEAAKANPSHRKSRAWLKLQHLTPKLIAEVLPYMAMHMPEFRVPKRKGRPRRPAISTAKMVEQLAERIERTGEKPTTAARRLLTEHGFSGDLKGRAQSLVRKWRTLKSR